MSEDLQNTRTQPVQKANFRFNCMRQFALLCKIPFKISPVDIQKADILGCAKCKSRNSGKKLTQLKEAALGFVSGNIESICYPCYINISETHKFLMRVAKKD